MTHPSNQYKNCLEPTWCKGCSYFSVMAALGDCLSFRGTDPLKVNIVSGIGCSSRLPLFLNTFGMHTLHGRALPVAIGARLARPDIPVMVVAGDGDLFSIGAAHFVHAARKNFNITVLCLDNRSYAMTKNQASPTSPVGYQGTLTPFGKLSAPLNVPEFAIACGATHVSRCVAFDKNYTAECIGEAFDHRGFSLVEILAPCKSFGSREPAKEILGRVSNLQDKKHDVSDRSAAMEAASRAVDYDRIAESPIDVGLFWKTEAPVFEDQVENVQRNWKATLSLENILDLATPEAIQKEKS